jgi:hypothetical protein
MVVFMLANTIMNMQCALIQHKYIDLSNYNKSYIINLFPLPFNTLKFHCYEYNFSPQKSVIVRFHCTKNRVLYPNQCEIKWI